MMNELPCKVEDWPEEAREMYEERAAIMEYDGKESSTVAEVLAQGDVRRIFRRRQGELPF